MARPRAAKLAGKCWSRFDDHQSRPNNPEIAAMAADPTRGRMLTAMIDGRAHTATELAMAGAVTPSTASSHLARMGRAGRN